LSRVPHPAETINALSAVVDVNRGTESVVELLIVSRELGILWRRAGRAVPPGLGWRCEAIGVGLLELIDDLEGVHRG